MLPREPKATSRSLRDVRDSILCSCLRLLESSFLIPDSSHKKSNLLICKRIKKKRIMSDHHEDFLGGMSGIQGLGIMNALRTGDPKIDMILAMAFPFILKLIIDTMNDVWIWIKENYLNWKPASNMHERKIVQ